MGCISPFSSDANNPGAFLPFDVSPAASVSVDAAAFPFWPQPMWEKISWTLFTHWKRMIVLERNVAINQKRPRMTLHGRSIGENVNIAARKAIQKSKRRIDAGFFNDGKGSNQSPARGFSRDTVAAQ
jgi:hypothetical protein